MGGTTDPRPVKVLVLTTSFPLTPESRSGIFVGRLISHLSPELQITVLTPAATGPCPGGCQRGITVKCFRYAPAAWQLLAHGPGGILAALGSSKWLFLLLPFFFLSMFVACLRQARHVDLIHANWSVNGVVAGLAGLLTRTPVITTLRGSDVNLSKTSRPLRLLLRCCLGLSRRVVVVSQALHQEVFAAFPKYGDRLTFIPNGVDDTFLAISPAENTGKIRLFYGGNLTAGKGVDTIILAIKKLAGLDDIELVIAGDGPQRMALTEQAQAFGVAARVRFLGQVDPQLMPDCLRAADIVVLASYREGRPNIVLEAMAAGRPVIATDIEGVRELVAQGQTGLLFEPGNAERLAQAITTLARDPEARLAMGTAARQFIISNQLTWPETGRRYADLFYDTVTPQAGTQ